MARRRKMLLSVLVAGGLSAVLAGVAYAAFTATRTNEADVFTGGTVAVTDSDGASALFALTGLSQSSTPTIRCIRVRYDGSLNAAMRLHASSTGGAGGDLAPELTLTIARGVETTPSPTCTSFTPDAGGTVYNGLTSLLPGGWTTGVVDPFDETWTTSETHSYRLTLAPRAGATGASMQGRSTLFTLTWEARDR